MSTRAIISYVVLVFVLGFAAQFAALHSGLDGPGSTWLRITMWVPAVAALLAGATSRRWVLQSLRRAAWRWWPVAFLLGWSHYLLACLLMWVIGIGSWNAEMFPMAPDGGIAEVRGVAMILGVGAQDWGWFVLNLLVTFLVASLLFAFLGGLGEELGWRAVLQRALDERWRPVFAAIGVGLIWAYWHLPVNLAGYNYPDYPVLSSLITFPLVAVAFALMYAWLWRRSNGSVWVVAIAHGGNNMINAGFVIAPDDPRAGMIGSVAAGILLAIVFGWLLWSDSRHSVS